MFLIGVRIAVATGLTLRGTSEQQSEARADGVSAGVVGVGVSLANAEVQSGGAVRLNGSTLTAGRDVTVRASGQGISAGYAAVSGVGADATMVANSAASLSLYLDTAGNPNRVTAGRNLKLEATEGAQSVGDASSPGYAFPVSVGQADATGSQFGTAVTDIGPNIVLAAGGGLQASATARQPSVDVTLILGGVQADGDGNPAESRVEIATSSIVFFGAAVS